MIPQSLGALYCEIKVAEEGLLTNQIQILNVFDSALFCLLYVWIFRYNFKLMNMSYPSL